MSTSTPEIVIEPRFRIRLGRDFELGPGKAELLELIETTGSISEAARMMKMSYMRAWTLVKSLDRGLREPLVTKTRGGAVRGGAALTATGRELLLAYQKLEQQCAPAVNRARAELGRIARA